MKPIHRDFAGEEWLAVDGTDDYQVSNLGRVRSLDRVVSFGSGHRIVQGRILKATVTKAGYARCSAHRHVSVHRLVAEAFCAGYRPGYTVNHKDGNRLNNHADNLEWVSYSDNAKHSFRVLGRANKTSGAPKRVEAVDVATGEVAVFASLNDTAAAGFSPSIVSKCLRGRCGYRSHKGKTWRYAKMKPIHRDFALREIGCVVAHIRRVGFLPCEKHHLLTTGRHGNGKRRGEQFTVGLNPWSHRGVVPHGWTEDYARELLGPSYAREPAAFRELYPDEVLLEEQEKLLKQWRDGVIG